MSEWLKEHAWKACVGETLPRVRIPLSPPPSVADAPSVAARAVFRHRAARFPARRAWRESLLRHLPWLTLRRWRLERSSGIAPLASQLAALGANPFSATFRG